MEPIAIRTRREPLVDRALIDALRGDARLTLHEPTPREVVLTTERPWEGNQCGYLTVLPDADRYRLYYKCHNVTLGPEGEDTHPLMVACAESRDGIHWERPSFGILSFEGSTDNNLIWHGPGEEQKGCHGFAPFKDPNPAADGTRRYKALGAIRRATKGDLYAMVSPDGVHWQLLQEEPVIRGCKFDSQNLAFWDAARGEYRAYMRDGGPYGRDIRTATSRDFVEWSEPELLDYPNAPGRETDQLYTNQVMPYPRAPHILVGFPTRYVQREWSPAIEDLPELAHRRHRAARMDRLGAALTDGAFMSSRDGATFSRWGEAFIRPGPQRAGNWFYGDNFQAWGMIETPSAVEGAPPELSFYATENYTREPATRIRRYTLRLDGFVSVRAGRVGGELVTPPIAFDGKALHLNAATSAAGSIRAELQDASGAPLEGFSLEDAHPFIGDEIERAVRWRHGTDVSAHAGRAVRLRLVIEDADLYALRFG